MNKSPDWLPPTVAEFANTNSGPNVPAEVRARLTRLVSDSEMKRVWSTLAKHTDPQGLRDYLRIAAWELNGLRTQALLDGPSHAQMRQITRRIAALLYQALAQLAKLAGKSNDPRAGVQNVLTALQRLAAGAVHRDSRDQLAQAMQLLRPLQTIDREFDIAGTLTTLAKAAKLVQAAPAMPGPRKRDAGTAARTTYIQQLVAHTRRACGQPLYAQIATTVNVALNDPNNIIAADHVRKLATGRKIIKRKAP